VRFENEFEVSGSPSQVIERLDDTPLMASLIPGASVGPANADGSFPGSLVVSFGPKRITFNGNVTHRVDRESCSGVLSGKASADVRGAKMAVTMSYQLSECAGSSQPRTSVKFISEAQLTGVLAEFAKTGGVVVTNAIFAEFARRFSAHFAGDARAPARATENADVLSTLSLAGQIVRALWFAFVKWLREPFRPSGR
jgi:carbon monoxide dehydrogenase subunit G